MNGETPLDLRALGEVDEPEVVREALRRFRRRSLARSAWVVAAMAVFAAAVVWGRTPTTLAERIDRADRSIEAHPIWEASDALVALDRVADLGDGRLGFHFVVIGRGVELEMTGQVRVHEVWPWDRYIEIEREGNDIPTLTILVGAERTEIPLGKGSGVPAAVWRL